MLASRLSMPDLPSSPSADVLPAQPVAQTRGTDATTPDQTAGATTPTSGRPAFRDIRRELSNEDLASPGVQKLLLDGWERADAQCEILNGYVERFHEADKRAAILEEKNRTVAALDIMFAVGVGVGCAIIALAPLFWSDQPKGWIALIVGVVLAGGAGIARVVKRWR